MPVTPGIWVAESSDYRPDRYYRYAELTELLHKWAAEHADIVTIESIGTSLEGRDIWALTITDRATGEPDTKPAYFVDANIHAQEVTGCATVLWLVNHVLTNQDDPAIQRLLTQTTLYIVPAINVDGMDLSLSQAVPGIRSSVRPWPHTEPQDGLVEKDIDGDGSILSMRIKDPAGPWTPSDHDPRIMRPRRADEFGGDYYHVVPEGEIQNWDGAKIPFAPSPWGLDANRNFPADWAPEWVQNGAGAYPLSEPETKALADFLIARPNIHGSQHFHTFSGCILRPPTSHPTADMPKLDQAIYTAIGQMGTEETGYPCIGIHDDFAYDKKKALNGGLIDWVFVQLGMIPFATELWSLAGKAGVEVQDFIGFFRDRSDEIDAKMLKVIDDEVGGEGFRDWTPFEHPQLGPVEIGGWYEMFTWANPPGPLLEEVTAGNARFVLRAAQTAPLLAIRDVEVEPVAEGVYKVSVTVHNDGFLPTHVTATAKQSGVNKPVKVTLELAEGGELVAGELEEEIGHLDGRANTAGQLIFGSGVSPVQDRARVSWVVKQPAGSALTVTATTAKAGRATAALALGEPAA
jgi:murein tripeptide amidase MpaA